MRSYQRPDLASDNSHPVKLSITHKWTASQFRAELDLHQAGPSAPHDHIARRRIVATCEVSAEPGDFLEVGGLDL